MLAIVTDSSAYLSKREAHILGVHVVSMNYTVAGRTYQEQCRGENGNYVSLLKNAAKPVTSQAPISAYASVFQELVGQGFEVLCIVISSRLSGTFSSACAAAREVAPEHIHVLDSLSTAGGMYLLAEHARRLAECGLSLSQVAAVLERRRQGIHTAFSVDDMEALRRSGRIGLVRRSFGTILNLRPILALSDGAIVSQTVARGAVQQREALLGMIPEDASRVLVQYFGEASEALRLAHRIKAAFPSAGVFLREAGPILAVHLGSGTLGVTWECR